MQTFSDIEIVELAKLALKESERTANYLQAIGIGLTEDQEDANFEKEQNDKILFFENLSNKLNKILTNG